MLLISFLIFMILNFVLLNRYMKSSQEACYEERRKVILKHEAQIQHLRKKHKEALELIDELRSKNQ